MANRTERITVEGPVRLEALLHLPDDSLQPAPGVVVCHPHPLYGGDMYNPVVEMVCSSALGCGFAALRFNFRGVGGSEGSHDQGQGEREDVLAALEALAGRPEVDESRLALAGYSFGAMMALACSQAAKALLLVSPPIGMSDAPAQLPSDMPVCVLTGSADQFVDAAVVEEEARAKPSVRLTVVPGADHFWWGQEEAILEGSASFLGGLFGDRA